MVPRAAVVGCLVWFPGTRFSFQGIKEAGTYWHPPFTA